LTEPDTRRPARDPELSRNPNKFAPPNGLCFEDGAAHLLGYQEFTVEPRTGHLRAIGSSLVAKEVAVERAFSPRFMAGRTVLDLGGNNGFFGFKALAAGAVSATVVDIDEECVLNLHRVRSRFPEIPLEAHQTSYESWHEPADVVVAFALVHWLYSCTARALSLDRVVGALASLARDMLLVEWVDPSDPLVQGFHHVEVTDGEAAGPYEFDAFLRALSAHFSRVELLAELSPTRRIYLATRGQPLDFSWRAPLLFPRQTLLTSRMLWATDGVEFWSRVHRVDRTIYRQCTPELAERELAGSHALGVPVEVLERHEDWWLLRASFIDGETLDERVAHGQVPREEILRLTLQLLDLVGELRRAGIVHRDFHPANLIVGAGGELHLIDFGWADMPGMPQFSPSGLGYVELPATRTTILVRPPETSGDDLFAVGRIIGWMNASRDPAIELLARWLGHADYKLRLRDLDIARALALRLLEPAGDEPSRAADGKLEQAMMQLSAAALERAARLEEQGAVTLREKTELQGEQRRLLGERDAARAHGQALEQSLASAQASGRELETRGRELETRGRELEAQGRELEARARALEARVRELDQEVARAQARTGDLEQQIHWIKQSRFWKAHDLWFAGKRALRLTR